MPVYVSNGAGYAWQTLYKAENNIRLQGTVEGTSVTQLTSTFTVTPGELSDFNMTGVPDSVGAGESFSPSSINVKLLDHWDNPKTDYEGQIFFTSSDPAAQLAYNSSNPYMMFPPHGGEDDFNGSLFDLRRAGNQTITVTNDTLFEQSDKILVTPDEIVSYQFESIPTQRAGASFAVTVQNANDAYGNQASGQINIGVEGSNHASPSGQTPALNNIVVINGSGVAQQILFKTESVRLTGTSVQTNTTVNTNSFNVFPADLHQLSEVSGSAQITQAGNPFPDPVTVTAYDIYDNEKIDFNGTVSFTSTDTEPATSLPGDYSYNNQASHDFAGVQFNLNTAGEQTITVASGAVQHTTDPIRVELSNPIRITRVTADKQFVTRGQDNITVVMEIQNTGTESLLNYQSNLRFRTDQMNVDGDYVAPSVSRTSLAAGQTTSIPFTVNVGAGATLGEITIDGAVSGTFDGAPLDKVGSEIIDSWIVQEPADVQISNLVIEADTIARESSGVPMRLTLENNNGQPFSAAAVFNAINFSFYSDAPADVSQFFDVTPEPGNPDTLAGNSSRIFNYYIAARDDAPLAHISVRVSLDYDDRNSLENTSFTSGVLESFQCVESTSLILTEVTPVNQPAVTIGQTQDFTIRVGIRNQGNAPLSLSFDPAETYVTLKHRGMEYISPNDIIFPSAFVGGGTNLPPQTTRYVDFVVDQVDAGVPDGHYSITARLTTGQGYYTTSNLSDVFGEILVQKSDDLRLVSLQPSRSPMTVTGSVQNWNVYAVLANYGGSSVDIDFSQTECLLTTQGGGLYPGLTIGSGYLTNGDSTLSALETDTLVFPIGFNNADPGIAMIDVNLDYSVNNTGQNKAIDSESVGKTSQAVLETPAEFSIRELYASQQTVTRNSTVNWWVTVVVENTGQAAVDVDLNSAAETWVRFYQNGSQTSGFQTDMPSSLAGGGTRLDGGEVDSVIVPITDMPSVTGEFSIKARMRAVELNRDLPMTFETPDPEAFLFKIEAPSVLSYQQGSLSPANIVPGNFVEFRLNIANSGEADVLLSENQTVLRISDGADQFTASVDGSFDTVLEGGATSTLRFKREYVSGALDVGSFEPVLTIRGTENGQTVNEQVSLQGDQVNVGVSGEFAILDLSSSLETVIRGQTNPFNIQLQIQNNSIRTLQFDDLNLIFNYNTQDVSDQFTLNVPGTFQNGTPYLQPQESGTLTAQVTEVSSSAPIGDVLLSAQVWMADSIDSGNKYQTQINNAGVLTVEEPANIVLEDLAVSQPSVIRGQQSDWYIIAYVRNTGGGMMQAPAECCRRDVCQFQQRQCLF
ncbi:MAG: hypothetical protein U5R06_17385 [candidate division KSB1 bacterium]|nr:hypothetical protein [candidate division KSB1 bacterium]